VTGAHPSIRGPFRPGGPKLTRFESWRVRCASLPALFSRRRISEAAERARERREREDACARLLKLCPDLTSLQLEVTEYFGERKVVAARHVRHIVVAHAPAMFLMGCTDSSCKDGGYDLTHEVLRALQARQTTFEGEQSCNGRVGNGECRRILHYMAQATYGGGTR
jgi:hypothetical protein